MSYNQLMNYIQKGTDAEEDPDSLFKFRDIVAHQGPLESTDPNHKGSKYNVLVEWESGEFTYGPLTLFSKDDQITCAVFAKKHDLLDTTGWKHLKRYAKTSKRLIRAVKQSRIRQVRASARYQHGFQVPKDYNDAMRLDKENGNTHWQDAMDLELTQIHEYKVFKDTVKAQFHNGKVVITITLLFPIPYPQQSTKSLPLDPLDASTPNVEQFVKSQSDEDEDNPIPMANIDIPNLLGRSFLLPPEDNGERHMTKSLTLMTMDNLLKRLNSN